MNDFAAIIDDDFTAFTASCFSQTRHSGLQTIEDCPSDWAVGSDEVGNPIICKTVIADLLQKDCF